jgi:hypothetical protein
MKNLILSVLIIVGTMDAFGQGFVNLDFESANPPPSGFRPGAIAATNAIPGWTAYLGGTVTNGVVTVGTNLTEIDYVAGNIDVNIGVHLSGNNPSGNFAIFGNYYVVLNGAEDDVASIGQTGTIPATAQSLIFDGSSDESNGVVVSFNGQNLPYALLGQSGVAFIYGADISAYAGQTSQLLFTSFSGVEGISEIGYTLDNIQFSSSAVPEPSPAWLVLLGSGIFVYGRRILRS